MEVKKLNNFQYQFYEEKNKKKFSRGIYFGKEGAVLFRRDTTNQDAAYYIPYSKKQLIETWIDYINEHLDHFIKREIEILLTHESHIIRRFAAQLLGIKK